MVTIKYINAYTGEERAVSPAGGNPYAYPVGYFDGPCPFDLLTAAEQRQRAQWLLANWQRGLSNNPRNRRSQEEHTRAQQQWDALSALPNSDDQLLALAQQAGGQLWAADLLVRDVARWEAYQARLQAREAHRREVQAAYARWTTGYWQALREGQVDEYVNASF